MRGGSPRDRRAEKDHGRSAVANRLECGTAWINTHLALAPHQPFGGAKWSGIGVENGMAGLEEYTQRQIIYANGATI